MKTSSLWRFTGAATGVLLAVVQTSCVTTYDAAGRPVQTVDPGMAAAGVAAAGLIGYAIGQNNDHHHGYYGGGYYQSYPGYYGGSGYNGYRGPRHRY